MSAALDFLNSLNAEPVNELIESLLDFLINPTTIDLMQQMGDYAVKYSLPPSNIRPVIQELLIVLQFAIKNGSSVSDLQARCDSLGLNGNIISIITNCWKNKASALVTCLMSRTVSNNQLTDLDWSFGVTASSDDSDHIGKTFLQLRFTVEGKDGSEKIFMELTLEQFYQLLASLEKCRNYLDYVNPTSV
eukprot:gene10084-13551_t